MRRGAVGVGLTAIGLAALSMVAGACSSFDGSTTDQGDARSEMSSPEDAADSAREGAADATTDAGPVFVLAEGRRNITAVAVSAEMVYFGEDSDGGLISAVPIGGGAVSTTYSGPVKPTSLAVGASRVYWLDEGSQRYARIDKNGGNLDVHALTGRVPVAVVEANGKVFLANTNPPSLETANAEFVVSNEIQPLGDPAQSLARAAGGDRMTWCEPAAGGVRETSTVAVAVVTIAAGEYGCGSTAADSFADYWVRQGRIVAKTRKGETVAVATDQSGAFSLVSDDEGSFWLTRDGALRSSSVVQYSAGGPAVTTLSSGFAVDFTNARIVALALAPTYVVWATSDGKILRLHR